MLTSSNNSSAEFQHCHWNTGTVLQLLSVVVNNSKNCHCLQSGKNEDGITHQVLLVVI